MAKTQRELTPRREEPPEVIGSVVEQVSISPR